MEKKIDMLLEYVAQITQELTEIKSTQHQQSQQLAAVQQSVARIEQEHGDRISALFDARTADREVIDQIHEKIDTLFEQISMQEIQIKLLKKTN